MVNQLPITQQTISNHEEKAENILETLVTAKGGTRRDPQVRLARGMARHHATGTPLIVSAPTSSGKSLAAFASARASEKPTIIATGTQALQNQLEEDGLMLAETVGDFNVAVLKGKSAYYCHLKAKNFLDNLTGKLDVHSEEAKILDWAEETETGDKKELNFPLPPEVWKKFSTTPAQCPASACPFFKQCFNEKAKSRAKKADIAIVNHALLAQGMKQEQFLSEKFENVIIDEAHEFPGFVGEAYGATINRSRLEWLGTVIRSRVTQEEHKKYQKALEVIGGYGKNLKEPLRHLEGHKIMQPIRFIEKTFSAVAFALQASSQKSERDRSAMKALQDVLSELEYFLQGDTKTRTAWIEWESEQFTLRSVLFNPGHTIEKDLLDKHHSVVFMSATIKVGGSFKNASHRLGVAQKKEWVGAEIPHLIDYEQNGLLWLPNRMKNPSDPTYLKQVAELATVAVKAARGRTLILCTSWVSVKTIGEHLKKAVGGKIPVYVQEPGVPLGPLSEKFKAEPESVLVGTRTLWTGVSFEGETCSCVLIDKLPFPSPSDPVIAARCEAVEEAGGNSFGSVLTPEACLTVTQGAGRLLRTVNDRGLLIIADPRVNYQSEHGKRYAQQVIKSLPPFPITRDSDEALAFLRGLREN